jgi:ABC-type transporter Mla MlaB component
LSRQVTASGSPRRTSDDAQLEIKVFFAPARPLVRLRGELRPGTVQLVRDALMALAATRGLGTLLVLDLSGLTRCDGASLRAVQESASFLAAAGKELSIQGVPACVLELLD